MGVLSLFIIVNLAKLSFTCPFPALFMTEMCAQWQSRYKFQALKSFMMATCKKQKNKKHKNITAKSKWCFLFV